MNFTNFKKCLGLNSTKMSSSSLSKHAQAIKLCELCDEDNIKWRCIDCDMCLCEKCQTFHLKVSVTARHQIVTITTPVQDIHRRIVTDNIPCKDHVTWMNCLYCKSCDCLVCPECVSTSHIIHQFIPIEKALDNKLEQLKGNQAKASANLKLCDSKTIDVQNVMIKYNYILDESVAKIKQREQELRETISYNSKILQEQVEGERSKLKTIVKEIQQDIEGNRKKFEDYKEELETSLTSNRGQVIFDTSLTEPVLKLDSLSLNVEHFIPETETKYKTQDLFGSFQKVTDEAESEFKVLRTFATDLPMIKKVIPLDETSAWITGNKASISGIRKISIHENNVFTTDVISLDINDMVLTADNDILVTVSNETDVKLVTKAGEIKSFLGMAPLFPIGIHITRDNMVIIGVKDSGDMFTVTDQSYRAIKVFDMEGKQRYVYQYEGNRKRLFTLPDTITTNNDGDIFVIDRPSNNSGRVVSLDVKGNLRWIYQGHFHVNVVEKFYPWGIAITAVGNIIVGDFKTHTVHVLSDNGNILTCKDMTDLGIRYPIGLNIDTRGQLWMSCGTDSKNSEAKLHIVKLMI